MKKLVILLLGALLVISLIAQGSTAAGTEKKILEFDTMVGVSGPYVGTANPIRGINGGGRPWVISEGEGKLEADGDLEVKVQGLVLASGPNIGTNPSANFRAVVSCQSIDGAGNAVVVNVSTGNFPATPTGDAEIKANIALPSPCIAPIIFVVSATSGNWFATTGF